MTRLIPGKYTFHHGAWAYRCPAGALKCIGLEQFDEERLPVKEVCEYFKGTENKGTVINCTFPKRQARRVRHG